MHLAQAPDDLPAIRQALEGAGLSGCASFEGVATAQAPCRCRLWIPGSTRAPPKPITSLSGPPTADAPRAAADLRPLGPGRCDARHGL